MTNAFRTGFVAIIALFLGGAWLTLPASAETGQEVAIALTRGDAYVSPVLIQQHKAAPGDNAKLLSAIAQNNKYGIAEKIALVSHYSPKYADTYVAARSLRRFVQFSGILVLVSPHGIGVSSDHLTLDEIRTVEQRARPVCLAQSYATCAVLAATLGARQYQVDQRNAGKSSGIFRIILLAIPVLLLVWFVRKSARRQRALRARSTDLQTAAGNTLTLADSAVNEIESSGSKMTPDIRADYDRALALRDQAKRTLDGSKSAEMLTQANQDSAQAVLALQGVMRKLNINSPLANPLETSVGHRCFYCSHEDQPPYTKRTIDDGKGNTMEVDVCSVCTNQLEQGKTPQVATVQYGGSMVPWWAVPGNPWYYGYGGPSWQYWLPFMIGMNVGGWYGGGWYGGFGGGPGYYGGGDYGGGDQVSGGTTDPGTDQGAGDFGGWGGDSGGGDPGGGDWGGGGGDWGGGGGGDSGGGGW